MRVLVTGGHGFAGRHVVAELLAHGHTPLILDLEQGPPAPDGPTSIAADVRDADALLREVGRHRPEGCIHLAGTAFIPAADEDPGLAFAINTVGTVNLLSAFRAKAPDAPVLVVTSAHIYGLGKGSTPIREDEPAAPDTLYAATKAAADTASLLHASTYGMPVMTARPNNHTGPGQSPMFVTSAFARQLIAIERGESEPVMHVGNLACRRDFLDVRDVARAYRLLLERGRAGRAYNISSGTLVRIETLLDRLCELTGVAPRREVDRALFRPTDDGIVLDVSRIREDTGWTPGIPLQQTLGDLLEEIRGECGGRESVIGGR